MKNLPLVVLLALAVALGCKFPSTQDQPTSSGPSTSGPTTSKPTDSPEEAIRGIYKKIDAAYMAEDADALLGFTSTDYTSKDEKGRVVSREQATKDIKENFRLLTEITEVKSDVMRVEEKDGLWNATVNMTLKGKVKVNGKTSNFESTNQSSDQWSKSSGGEWKCIRSITQMSNTKLDGKTVNN